MLVQTFWDSSLNVDSLEVQASLAGAMPTSQMVAPPSGMQTMSSPYKLLLNSPADKSLDVTMLAHAGGRVVAQGRVSVTPSGNEWLQVGLHLESSAGPRCGDGHLDAGEECDDGNREDRDGCTNACTCARCGDGVLHHIDDTTPVSCTSGMPDALEQCDDGNTVSGDGCSATCTYQ